MKPLLDYVYVQMDKFQEDELNYNGTIFYRGLGEIEGEHIYQQGIVIEVPEGYSNRIVFQEDKNKHVKTFHYAGSKGIKAQTGPTYQENTRSVRMKDLDITEVRKGDIVYFNYQDALRDNLIKQNPPTAKVLPHMIIAIKRDGELMMANGHFLIEYPKSETKETESGLLYEEKPNARTATVTHAPKEYSHFVGKTIYFLKSSDMQAIMDGKDVVYVHLDHILLLEC